MVTAEPMKVERPPLIACPTCGKEVASKARKCPHCGGGVTDSSAPFWIVAAIVVVALIAGVIYGVHQYHHYNHEVDCSTSDATGIPNPDCP